MKLNTSKILISSAMCAALAFGSNAMAQDRTNNTPAPVPANDQAAQNNAVVVNQTSLDDMVNDDGSFYDPSVIDPSISERTNKNTQAARSVLEATHDSPMPRAPESMRHQQALPGEDFLNDQIDQISELNEIKPGPAITLKDALLLADEQNIDLQVAQTKIDAARAQLKQAWALLLPNISASLSWAHMGYPSDSLASTKKTFGMIGEGLADVPALSSFAPMLEGLMDGIPSVYAKDALAVNLTVGLSIINVAGWFQLRMADEAVEITKLGIEDGRQQLLSGVAQCYLAALLTGEVVKVQRVQLKSALDQLSLAQGRYDRGADVKLSVIQAQFGVEKQRQALIDAIWSYETARDALANLINTDGLPVPQPTHIKNVQITSDEELEKEAIEQNRTLKMNRATQHINELNLNAAIASFAPTLSGFWKFDYTYAAMETRTSKKDDAGEVIKTLDHSWAGTYDWTLGLSLSIPLFDYSKFGVLDERQAAIRETQLSIESTQNATRTAVRKAKREYYSALFSVDNAKRQVELAREALQLTEAAYQNGASTFIDVSDARNNVAAASIAYITAGIQAELSMVSLISTLGRDLMEVVY